MRLCVRPLIVEFIVACEQESDCKPDNGRPSETDAIRLIAAERMIMTADSNMKKPFNYRFIDAPPKVVVKLTNASEYTLKSIEILTVFLKDNETPGGGPSQAPG